MTINAAVTIFVFLIGVWMLRRILPRAIKDTPPEYRMQTWVSSALPLLFVSGIGVINAQIALVVLGSIKDAEEAGVYAVANRGAELVTFVMFASSAALGPVVASLYATGDLERLQRMMTKSARLIFCLLRL